MKKYFLVFITILFMLSCNCLAQEKKKEEKKVVSNATAELPKILYVVPWQDITGEIQAKQKLTLHSLFGDFYEPLVPPKPTDIK